jgi:hypothetical protein
MIAALAGLVAVAAIGPKGGRMKARRKILE